MPDWQSLDSTNVKACRYDPETRTLEIRYVSGQTYPYQDVPLGVYEGLLSADSPGRFVNGSIKGVYG